VGGLTVYAYGFFLALGFIVALILAIKTADGQIFWLFLLLYAVTRFFIEILRGDPRRSLFQEILSTSQEIGICLAFVSLFMLFYLRKAQRRR
jgi:phosphatidylglycerol:prolipoprotein diacylglycerol transferase